MKSFVNRSYTWIGLGILMLCLALFAPAFSGAVLAQRDLLRLTYPFRWLAAAQWASGVLPLWNSASGCGMPLLADPVSGVLDPFTAFFLLPFAPATTGTFVLALRYGLAALLMTRYLVRRGVDVSSASFGGVVYMLAGFSIGSWTLFQWVAALPLLPLAMATPQSHGTPVGRGLAAAAVFALFTFSGAVEPLLAAIVFWLIELSTQVSLRGRRAVCVEAVIGLLGATAFALVQIVPTMELWSLSDRWGGRGVERALTYSVSPLVALGHALPVTFVAPDGGPAPAGLFPFPHPLFFGTYIGAALLPLVILGIAPGRRRFAVIAIVAALLASGRYVPGVTALMARAPWLTVFGFPVKIFVAVPPALAILAAHGLSGAWDRSERMRGVACVAAALLLILVVAFGIVNPDRFLPPDHAAFLVMSMTSMLSHASQHALLALLASTLILLGTPPTRKTLGRILLVSLIVMDMGLAARGALLWNGAELTQEPELRAKLPDLWPRLMTTTSTDFADGGNGAGHVHQLMDVNSGLPWRVRHVGAYTSFQILEWNRWWDSVIAAPDGGLKLLGAMGVRWFACDEDVMGRAVSTGWRVIAKQNGLILMEHPAPLPEIRFYAGEIAPTHDRLLAPGVPVKMAVRHQLDGQATAHFEAPGAGWVFRAEAGWFPGWVARRNGRDVEVSSASGMPGQLVRVEAAGPTEILWRYRPAAVFIGLAGSFAACMLAILTLFFAGESRPRQRGVAASGLEPET